MVQYLFWCFQSQCYSLKFSSVQYSTSAVFKKRKKPLSLARVDKFRLLFHNLPCPYSLYNQNQCNNYCWTATTNCILVTTFPSGTWRSRGVIAQGEGFNNITTTILGWLYEQWFLVSSLYHSASIIIILLFCRFKIIILLRHQQLKLWLVVSLSKIWYVSYLFQQQQHPQIPLPFFYRVQQ